MSLPFEERIAKEMSIWTQKNSKYKYTEVNKMMKIQVMLSSWVIYSQHFEGMICSPVQGPRRPRTLWHSARKVKTAQIHTHTLSKISVLLK
jgi:hypothetical protein